MSDRLSSCVIVGGTIINRAGEVRADVLVENGFVTRVGSDFLDSLASEDAGGPKRLDARGC